ASAVLAGLCEIEPTKYGSRLLRMRSPSSLLRKNLAGSSNDSSEAVNSVIAVEREAHEAWVGEFRTLTIVRVGLPGLQFDQDFLPKVQEFVLAIQRVSQRLEGTVHQILMDDKGLTLTLIFGLAPFAHEEDPLRAVEASLRIRRQ